jgi:hypothetical protein
MLNNIDLPAQIVYYMSKVQNPQTKKHERILYYARLQEINDQLDHFLLKYCLECKWELHS